MLSFRSLTRFIERSIVPLGAGALFAAMTAGALADPTPMPLPSGFKVHPIDITPTAPPLRLPPSGRIAATEIAPPYLVYFGNDAESCQKSIDDTSMNCMAYIHDGLMVVTLAWDPCTGAMCVQRAKDFTIYRVPPPGTVRPRGDHTAGLATAVGVPTPSSHMAVDPSASRTQHLATALGTGPTPNPNPPLPADHVSAGSGFLRGVTQSSIFGTVHITSTFVKAKAGDCFTARVRTSDGFTSGDGPVKCVDDSTTIGMEDADITPKATQGRQFTRDGCNKNSYKTILNYYDAQIGTQYYTSDACSGSWSFWTLVGFDLGSYAHRPYWSVHLVGEGNFSCVHDLAMVDPNWEFDKAAGNPAVIAFVRPVTTFHTRALPGSPSLDEDVTDWVNSAPGAKFGFRFSQGSDTAACLHGISGVHLHVTRMR